MKIIKVIFENLNSLAGRWEINFTAPEFERSPLFVITGPTGSGKTTILDAVSLALYGSTARLNNLSHNSNEVMTRGTGSCFSEVFFEAAGERYRARWFQSRAYNKWSGKLQLVKQSIHYWDQLDEDKAICSGKENCSKKIVEITGLTFEQFSQSVMLSQGQFAQFLKSKPNDRADLLEKMTGTHIYTAISKMVYRRYTEKEKELSKLTTECDTLKNVLLDEKTRKEHEQWLRESKDKIENISQQIQLLTEQKQWLLECRRQKEEEEAVEKEREEYARQLKEFEEERIRLKRGMSAQKHETALYELKRVKAECRQKKEQLGEAENRVDILKKSMDDAAAKVTAAEQKLSKAEKDNEDAQPKLEAMIEADAEINHISMQLRDKQIIINKHAKEVETAKKQSEDDAQKVSQTAAELEQYKAWLNEHQTDRELSEAYPRIELLEQSFKRTSQNLARCEKDLQKSRTKLLETQNAFNQAQENYQQNECQKSKAVDARQKAENRLNHLLDGKTRDELESELETLKSEQTKFKSYEEARHELHAGEPCPLCGSVHHPWADEIPQHISEAAQKIEILRTLIKDIKAAEKSLAESKEAQNETEKRYIISQKEVEKYSISIEQHNEIISSQETEYQEHVRLYDADKQDFLENIHRFEPDYILKSNSEILEKLKKRIEDYKKHIEKSRELESSIAQAKEKASSSGATYQAACRTLDNLKNEHAALQIDEENKRASRIERYGSENPKDLRMQLFNNIKKYKTEKANADSAVTAAQKAFEENQQHITRLKEDIQVCIENIQDRHEKLLTACQNDHFGSIEAMESSLLDPKTMKFLQNKDSVLNQKGAELAYRTDENSKKKTDLYANPLTDKTLDEVSNELKSYNDKINEIHSLYGQKKEIIDSDNKNRENWNSAQELKDKFLPEYSRWANLNQKIGSESGNKYKVFVQNLTIKFLIQYANSYLKGLTARYKLIPMDYTEETADGDSESDIETTASLPLNSTDDAEINQSDTTSDASKSQSKKASANKNTAENTRKKEDYKKLLNFQLIDSEMNDIRPTDNLSGGETFLVSLALALGLSEMASRHIRIDTLYIDEGFGTLDYDTLSRTLKALCEVNRKGRQIGIITHVESVLEDVTTQIIVSSDGTSGRSVISGAGVKRL